MAVTPRILDLVTMSFTIVDACACTHSCLRQLSFTYFEINLNCYYYIYNYILDSLHGIVIMALCEHDYFPTYYWIDC